MYVFFGGLTTAVNWAVYFPLYNFAYLEPTLCNVIAWIVSVAFAFLTNKPFVFESHDWSRKIVLNELSKFVSARILSGLLETGFIFLFVTCLGFDGNVIKIVVSIGVVIFNYVASKLLVFRK